MLKSDGRQVFETCYDRPRKSIELLGCRQELGKRSEEGLALFAASDGQQQYELVVILVLYFHLREVCFVSLLRHFTHFCTCTT
jgi:hypothetical protein